MKCKNCKNELENENAICTKCNLSKEDIEKADKLTSISAILIFPAPVFAFVLALYIFRPFIIFTPIFVAIGLAIAIYTKIKYPKHKDSRNLIIAIILTVAFCTYIILEVISFVNGLKNCSLG